MRMLDPRIHRKKLFYTMDCRAKPSLPRPSMSMLDAAKTWMPGTSPGMTYPAWYRSDLRLQLGVPIEIVEPAVVQIVRREAPAVAVQMIDGRLERHLRRPHLGLFQRHVAFLEIAARARQQMIEG